MKDPPPQLSIVYLLTRQDSKQIWLVVKYTAALRSEQMLRDIRERKEIRQYLKEVSNLRESARFPSKSCEGSFNFVPTLRDPKPARVRSSARWWRWRCPCAYRWSWERTDCAQRGLRCGIEAQEKGEGSSSMRGVSGKRTAPPRRHKTICQLWRTASSCPTLIFGAARLHARSPGTHPLSHSAILIFTHHMLKNVRKEDCIKLFKTCHPQPRCVYTSSHLISCATSHTHSRILTRDHKKAFDF